MRKEIKPGRQYFIINMDEPYAAVIYAVLKSGQQAKGQWPEGDIGFDEWKRLTFSQPSQSSGQDEACDNCGATEEKCEWCSAHSNYIPSIQDEARDIVGKNMSDEEFLATVISRMENAIKNHQPEKMYTDDIRALLDDRETQHVQGRREAAEAFRLVGCPLIFNERTVKPDSCQHCSKMLGPKYCTEVAAILGTASKEPKP